MPVFPKADLHRILSNFWLFIHLMGKSEQFSVVLICMPYIMSEITHLFNIFKTHLYFLFGELSINMLYPFLLLFFFSYLLERALSFRNIRSLFT